MFGTPVIRTWYAMGVVIVSHIGIGFVMSFPAVLTPSITNTNTSDIPATREQAAWIASAYPAVGPIGYLIGPLLMQMYGRRFIYVFINLSILIGNIVIATASSITALVIGRAIQGFSFSALYITVIMSAEYTHPKKRGTFISLKTAASGFGVFMCHVLGFSIPWRQVAWIAAVPSTLAAIGTFFMVESPAWLAYKGRFDDSRKSFQSLRGTNAEARKEIKELILAQTARINAPQKTFVESLKIVFSRSFMKPLTLVAVLSILVQACGRYYAVSYLAQIMIQASGDESQAYWHTIGFDLVNIIGIFVSIFTITTFKRRFLLFTSGGIVCSTLALFCIVQYLSTIGVIHFKWLTPLLLIFFNFVNFAGLMPSTFVLKGEVVPLEYRGSISSIAGIVYSISALVFVRSMSKMLIVLDTHGTFAVYTFIAVLCLLYLYFTLPETKDRTLQAIESEFITRIPIKHDEEATELKEFELKHIQI